nr:hypothetical protein TetV2_00384 [Oceanusvirus sp.]
MANGGTFVCPAYVLVIVVIAVVLMSAGFGMAASEGFRSEPKKKKGMSKKDFMNKLSNIQNLNKKQKEMLKNKLKKLKNK